MLRDNRAEYLRSKSRGIPRDGAALSAWHHLVRRVRSQDVRCATKAVANTCAITCVSSTMCPFVSVCGRRRSTPKLRSFPEAVAPAEIDAWITCSQEQSELTEALRHAEEQQVQRLRYQAALAERQFNRVDPDNRLVAGELERRWEAALIELRRAEEALARSTASTTPQPVGVDPRLRAKVVALGERLPALWADPATRREHRKALLRCLIEKVVMRRSSRDQAEVRIVWRGGAATELTVMMPVNALEGYHPHRRTHT